MTGTSTPTYTEVRTDLGIAFKSFDSATSGPTQCIGIINNLGITGNVTNASPWVYCAQRNANS
eukprot:41706-Eustigmatos_ZCMA.PRE.1